MIVSGPYSMNLLIRFLQRIINITKLSSILIFRSIALNDVNMRHCGVLPLLHIQNRPYNILPALLDDFFE